MPLVCRSGCSFGSSSFFRRQGVIHQKKVKTSGQDRTNVPRRRHISGGQRRRAVRALSYIVALVLVLAAPLSAGSAERDMPGIGTFAYNGSPVLAPASSRMMAAVNIDH
jgi:ABC-type amino acid transport system permease subunit